MTLDVNEGEYEAWMAAESMMHPATLLRANNRLSLPLRGSKQTRVLLHHPRDERVGVCAVLIKGSRVTLVLIRWPMFARLRVVPIGWRQLTVGSVDPRTNSDGKNLFGGQAPKPRKSVFVPRLFAWFNGQRFAALHNSKCGAKHLLDASRIADRDLDMALAVNPGPRINQRALRKSASNAVEFDSGLLLKCRVEVDNGTVKATRFSVRGAPLVGWQRQSNLMVGLLEPRKSQSELLCVLRVHEVKAVFQRDDRTHHCRRCELRPREPKSTILPKLPKVCPGTKPIVVVRARVKGLTRKNRVGDSLLAAVVSNNR